MIKVADYIAQRLVNSDMFLWLLTEARGMWIC